MEIRNQVAQEMLEQMDQQNAEHRRQIDAIYQAADAKANAKLDIMARMSQSRFCENCEEPIEADQSGDVTMDETPDQSFVSALASPTSRRVSSGDPFVVRTGAQAVRAVNANNAGVSTFAMPQTTVSSNGYRALYHYRG